MLYCLLAKIFPSAPPYKSVSILKYMSFFNSSSAPTGVIGLLHRYYLVVYLL